MYASSLFAGRSNNNLASLESDVEPNPRPTLRSPHDRDKFVRLYPRRDPLPRTRSHQGSLAEILLRCWRLRDLKGQPGIPSAFPILFLGPTLRFQEMKIGRGARPFAKMTGGEKGIIDPTTLYLGAIEFITNTVVIGGVGEALLQILKREISGDSGKRDRFAVSLGQLVGGAKIILAGLVFRHAKPGITKPVGMLLNGPGNLLGVAAFGPKREEREFLCFTKRL